MKSLLFIFAPEFKERADADTYLEVAQSRTSKVFFGDTYGQAVALRAAHMMKLTERHGDGGAVSGKREGDLSVSFSAPAGVDDLNMTAYGMQLKALIRSRQPMIGVVNGGFRCG